LRGLRRYGAGFLTALKIAHYPFRLLGNFISFLVTNLLLCAFYYGILTSFALLFRLFTRRDPLRLRPQTHRDSLWTASRTAADLRRYLRPF
jgi:hypothetical protein